MTDTPPSITPRDLRFGILENADRAWFDGDPVKSAIVDGFAVLLPVGERFFIRSLKHYAGAVEDPVLLEGIRDFTMQEAFHTREHEAYNAALRKMGVPVDAMEASVARLLEIPRTPIARLATTCAVEQLTYALSRFLLSKEGLLDSAAPAYRRLWHWHALEEVEHAAVALGVFDAAPWDGPGWRKYLLRATNMNLVLIAIVAEALGNAATILRGPAKRLSFRLRLRMAWALLVSPGFLGALVIPTLAYLRPGYRGGGGRDQRLVDRGRRLLREDPAPA